MGQIFDAFFTTKGEGMGMGLAIARSIVEAHDGQIAAENNVGGGATVWFSVPKADIVKST
jgi:signal transduction histidine kinase